MTEWVLKCSVCGTERRLDVGFNLAVFKGRIYLYCRKCRANREHRILGYMDGDRLRPPEEISSPDIID